MLLRNFPWLTAQVRLTVFHVGVHSEAPGHDEVAKLTWEKKSSNVKSPPSTSFGCWFSTISECFLGKFLGQNPFHRRFLEAKPLNHQTQTLRQILDPFSCGRFQCLVFPDLKGIGQGVHAPRADSANSCKVSLGHRMYIYMRLKGTFSLQNQTQGHLGI